MGFAIDIQAFGQKALTQANKSCCNAVESLFTDEVVLSPIQPVAQYSTGLLKNSYYAKVGGFDLTVGTSPNSSGGDSLSRIKAMLAEAPFLGKDNFVTLTNSVEEAYRADVLGWPAGEGANGWVWSGRVQAYGFTSQAVNNFKGAYAH
jgi:hypothetical protein